MDFVKKVHQKMFDDTWRWAGKFRNTIKLIGVNTEDITTELKKFLDDVIFQVKHNSYSSDEIAYRFHHRLVKIHPFPNGNGRHSRLITDMLLISFKQPRFNWGKEKISHNNTTREQYIDALKAADNNDYQFLSKFVRS